MKLSGDTKAYLERSADGQSIYKIGLSASLELRHQAFQKSTPRGVFNWGIEHTSQRSGFGLIQSFEPAVVGENAIYQ